MPQSLESRFLNLLSSLPGSESLDTPGVLPTSYQGKRADFALFKRSLVAEVKTLQDDPSARVQTIVDEYQARPGFPLVYGQVPLAKLLAKTPLAMQEEIRKRVAVGVTTALARGVAEANRQIRQTKKVLGLQEAGGLLVVLNDDVPILSPNLIVYRIQELLQKQRDGKPRFEELDWVMSISSPHLIQAHDGTWAQPIMLFQGPPSKTSKLVEGFADYIRVQWGVVENARTIESNADKDMLENYRVNPKVVGK